MISDKEKLRIQSISDLLYQASRSTQILSHLACTLSVREQFFKNKTRELPIVSYPNYLNNLNRLDYPGTDL
jgi:hypothetical protein